MNRFLPRPSAPRALVVLCLLVLTGCGPGRQDPGIVLEPATDPPASSTDSAEPSAESSPGPAPGPDSCFEVATAYTALSLVPLSTGERDPGFDPDETAASVGDLAVRMPAELRPALERAADELRMAGDSLQPGDLAELQQELAPVDDWLQQHCAEPAPEQ